MDAGKFAAYLAAVVSPAVVGALAQMNGGDETKAFESYYTSHVYAVLSDEATKVWHFSPQLLAHLVDEECKTGRVEFPEEAS